MLLHGLPPHKIYRVTLTFFPVGSASSQPPFNSNTPKDKWTDTASVKETDEPDDKPLRFRCERTARCYYLGVGVIASLERGGNMFAHVERFFPMT